MHCRHCGQQVEAIAAFCPHCGVRPLKSNNYCQACGAATTPEQEMCTSCGSMLKTHRLATEEDAPGLAKAVSCCFPIVGLILYFVWQNERPRAAKAVCQWAVLGVILGSFLYLVSMCAGYTLY
ncbi:MAG TPA: zinc ribbon domain-containing protein [Firmicutes bacterium]|nr:zinc ribbon domain-containing protein [Bacillota bacterium]